MITQIKLTLNTENENEAVSAEWGYRLYAGYLKEIPDSYVEKLHVNGITPVSQFLTRENGKVLWIVNLLGEEAEAVIRPALMEKEIYHIPQEVKIADKKVNTINDVDALFAMASVSQKHRLEFVTPTAFKVQGQYTNLPTLSLCMKSLIRKWNVCFPEAMIEDEDGQGIDELVNGLFCPHHRIRDSRYTIKGNCIYGFRGELTIKNNLKGFQKELADMLLYFSQYSGIGIKTTLGMGGVKHYFV